MGQTKPAADDPAIAEQPLDLRRMRVGADVEVLRRPAEQQIPDAAADQIGQVIGLIETIEDAKRVRVNLAARYSVLGARNDDGIWHGEQL